jgi:porphobilinogen synthase
MTPAPYPAARMRRLRRTRALRDMVQENGLSAADLIWPVFIRDGDGVEEPISSLPGVARLSLDRMLAAAEGAHKLGVPAICLFPYTDQSLRTETCEEAWNPDNLTNRAIRMLKAELPDLMVMTDIALDPYNANGHDGFVVDGEILNDETVEALVKMGLAQADAGADILGPSDMMDGRIGALRSALEGRGTAMLRSCPMRRNLRARFTGRSATRWAQGRGWWGTRPAIRSTRPMRPRRWPVSRVIWQRGRIW